MTVRSAFAIALLGPGLLIGARLAHAEDAPKESKKDAVVKVLRTDPLPDLAGKEALVLTVEYPPGGASSAHRHDADVFVYVLEGSLVMQVDGQSPVTLTAGQTFHELPGDVHRQSANASTTKPAKFLVFMVKDAGKPATTAVPAKP